MKLKSILLLLANFVTLSTSVNDEKTTSKSITLETSVMKVFEEECPLMSKIIHDKNVLNYTTNCSQQKDSSEKLAEGSALQNACHVVSRMLYYICKNKLVVTSDFLNLNISNKISVCPFNFSQIVQLKDFKNVEKVFTNERLCDRVCYDLDQPVKQCVVLHSVNEYLKNNKNISDDKPAPAANKTESNQGHEIEVDTPKVVPIGQIGAKIESQYYDEKINPKLEPIPPAINIKPPEKIVPVKVEPVEPDTSKTESQVSGGDSIKTEVSDKHKTEANLWEKNEEENKDLGNPEDAKQDYDSKLSDAIDNEKKDEDMQNENLQPDMISPSVETKSANILKEESVLESLNDDYDGDDDVDRKVVSEGQRLEDSESRAPVSRIEVSQASQKNEYISTERFFEAEESHFFFYFLMFSSVVVIGYLAFRNKNKILAYALEGKNGRRSRRRPNPAKYRKLESNLEEAIASNVSHTAASSVVY